MKSISFDRLVFTIIAALVLVLAAIILFGNLYGARPPEAVLPEGGAVGMRGPFTILFPQEMQHSTVEKRFETEPPLSGNFRWEGRKLFFWPNQPLVAGQSYRVRLTEGALTADGRAIRKEMQTFIQVRLPEVVFMSPVTGDAEIWISSIEPAVLRPITQTGGSVYDFGITPDGEHIIYSARNEMEGLDLWMIDRQGANKRLLLDCGPDWCSNPALSPNGARLAYARRNASLQPGGPPGVPRIWLLSVESGQTSVLYNDPEITGFDPVWSPMGDRLAFFDGTAGGIRILAIDKEDELLLPSNMGTVGAWSPDGQRMMFIDMESSFDRPYIAVYEANFADNAVVPALSSDLVRSDYGKPVWSPDGEWIAIGIRPIGGSGTQQIWVMRPDGSDALEVTSDFNYVHTAYRWDPGGNAIVFQRLNLTSSNNLPEVLVWQRDTGKFTTLGQDSGFAEWLP
jgi:TolB protein